VFHTPDNETGWHSAERIYLEFDVPVAGQIIYAGHIHLNFRANRLYTSVSDDFSSAVPILKSQFPLLNQEPVKQLFKLEDKR